MRESTSRNPQQFRDVYTVREASLVEGHGTEEQYTEIDVKRIQAL